MGGNAVKIIPWMYSTRNGRGYQMIMSGSRQYNVKWMYGADHVVVEVSDKHEEPFTEHKRVSIPGDYKGKWWEDIVMGMEDHMRVICSGLTRECEGYSGMDEFREEWAMHKFWPGQKVSYSTVRGGTVLGVVTGSERHLIRRVVKVRVTSRKNGLYRCGEILELSPTNPWVKSREV
jgi:hypothetical protein